MPTRHTGRDAFECDVPQCPAGVGSNHAQRQRAGWRAGTTMNLECKGVRIGRGYERHVRDDLSLRIPDQQEVAEWNGLGHTILDWGTTDTPSR